MHHLKFLQKCRALRRNALSIGLILCGGVCAQAAFAADVVTSVGGSRSDGDWSAAASLDIAGALRGFGGSGWRWQPVAALTLMGGHGQSWRRHNDRNVAVASAGAALSLRDSGWFLAVEAGAADRTTPAISGHFQFVSSLGWRGKRIQIQLRHISNGRIGPGPNLGESMALVGYRF